MPLNLKFVDCNCIEMFACVRGVGQVTFTNEQFSCMPDRGYKSLKCVHRPRVGTSSSGPIVAVLSVPCCGVACRYDGVDALGFP